MYDVERCKKCEYSFHNNGMTTCDYILIEGHMRGCYEGTKCSKFKKKKSKRRFQFFFGGGNEEEQKCIYW